VSTAATRLVARFSRQRLLARRAVSRELDELLGIYRRPDVAALYAVPPSREAELANALASCGQVDASAGDPQ
jgi:hypothetical protein